MKARDAHQLRLARTWHFLTAGLAIGSALIALLGLAEWGYTREIFGGSSSEGINRVFFNVMLGIFLAGSLACLAIATLSMAVALNIRRRRHHRFNLIASVIACAFVPVGTIAGIITVAVLNRESVRDAFGVSERTSKGTQPGSAGKKIRHDESAESSDASLPGFIARPKGAPAYHGFTVVPETETDGWVYGAVTEHECAEPQTEGDGFVIAPDGSRAGIAWAVDTPDFYEILPPDSERWGVYGVRFPQAVSNVDDLVANFRAILPQLKRRHAKINEGHD